jgi:hypothetical protein
MSNNQRIIKTGENPKFVYYKRGNESFRLNKMNGKWYKALQNNEVKPGSRVKDVNITEDEYFKIINEY